MTREEKAKELINKFYYMLPNNGGFTGINNVESRYKEAKQCALIAVDEIIEATVDDWSHNDWWQEVKEAVENL